MTSEQSTVQTAVRPAYRPFVLTVQRAVAVSAHFVRITFTGDDLEHFGTAGFDQRIKIVLPGVRGEYADFGQHDEAGDWYDRWRALPTAERNIFRTYTVRRIDPVARELDVDFVVHHDPGPAGRWAESASAGSTVVIIGPDQRSTVEGGGRDWHPGTATRVLLAGDETAVPAITAILDRLSSEIVADVFLEVPSEQDILPIRSAAAADVRWLVRSEADTFGALFSDALRTWSRSETALLRRAAAPRGQVLADVDVDRELLWDSPEDGEGEFYAWIAGEAAAVKLARRHLVSECGVDRRRVAFMGYWRHGLSERIE